MQKAAHEIQRMLGIHQTAKLMDQEEESDWFDKNLGSYDNFYLLDHFTSFDVLRQVEEILKVLEGKWISVFF